MRRNEGDSHLKVCCVLTESKCQESSSFCVVCCLQERAKELTTAQQRRRVAVPREIWREKEALKLSAGPGSYLRRRRSGPPDSSRAHCRTWKNKQPFHTTAITTKTQLGRGLQRRTDTARVESSTKEATSTKQQRREVWFCRDISISHVLCLHFTWCMQCHYWKTLKGKCWAHQTRSANHALSHPQQGKGSLEAPHNNDAENWQQQRNSLWRPAVETLCQEMWLLCLRNHYVAPTQKSQFPILCTPDRHSIQWKAGVRGLGTGGFSKKGEKDGACEELVLSRKWGHLVASYKNVRDELNFSVQKPNWEKFNEN